MAIAIIPARGGSKRIPRKNIRSFHGKPMISWSIHAAIDSSCFERIVVSTDDEEIADVAKASGAEVPFVRPDALADDFTPTVPVICHAIKELEKSGTDIDHVCCIYATAPFLEGDDIRQALKLLQDHDDCHYVASVTTYAFPIARALLRDSAGQLSMLQETNVEVRSQDLDEAWHDAGQFYWGRASSWVAQHQIFNSHTYGFPLPRYRTQDIDTLEDWETAELLFAALQQR